MKTKFDKLVKKLPFHLQQSLRQALIREKIKALFVSKDHVENTLDQFEEINKKIKTHCREMAYDYAKDRMFRPEDISPEFYIELFDGDEEFGFYIGIENTNYNLEIRVDKGSNDNNTLFFINKQLSTLVIATTQQVVNEIENIGLNILNSSFSALCKTLKKDPDVVINYLQKLIKEDNDDMNRFLYRDLYKMMGIPNELAIKKDIETDGEWQ